MPPNNPDETPIAELPVLQAMSNDAITQMVEEQQRLAQASAIPEVYASGTPAPERPAPAQPASFLETVERWDDDEDAYPIIEEVPSVVQGTPPTEGEQQTSNEMSQYKEVPSGFPNPEAGELIMTRSQLGRCRKQDIKTKRMRAISLRATDTPSPGWWAGFGLGYAEAKVGAAVFSYDDIMTLSTEMRDTYFYVIYDEPPQVAPEAKSPAKSEPVRRSNWVTLLGQQLVAMIVIAPKNNTFRSRIMAVLKESPPDDCVTADQIKDWVEFNFPRDPSVNQAFSLDLKFRMNFNNIETGTCNYRRRAIGSYNGGLTKDEILEIVRHSDLESFDGLMVNIRQACEDKARQGGAIHYERIEETGHQVQDSTDHDSDMLTSIRGPVTNILREILSSEECDILGI